MYVRTDRLGEAILTLPAVAAIKQAWPAAHVTFLSHPALVELLRDAPMIDRVIGDELDPSPPWWWRAVRRAARLRALGCDAVVVSNPSKELHLSVWLAGIPVRVGYDRKWAWTLTRRLSDDKALGERHEVEYNLELISRLGLSIQTVPSAQLSVRPDSDAAVSRLLAEASVPPGDRLVAVHPWTSIARKQWPLERLAQLVARMACQPQIAVVLVGGSPELAEARRLMGEPALRVVNLIGRLSLPELAALLRRSRVLVSADSGPVHVAAAVGTPTVALFGTSSPSTGPVRWGPWGQRHTVIWKPAMEQISVEEVAAAVQRYLS